MPHEYPSDDPLLVALILRPIPTRARPRPMRPAVSPWMTLLIALDIGNNVLGNLLADGVEVLLALVLP